MGNPDRSTFEAARERRTPPRTHAQRTSETIAGIVPPPELWVVLRERPSLTQAGLHPKGGSIGAMCTCQGEVTDAVERLWMGPRGGFPAHNIRPTEWAVLRWSWHADSETWIPYGVYRTECVRGRRGGARLVLERRFNTSRSNGGVAWEMIS